MESEPLNLGFYGCEWRNSQHHKRVKVIMIELLLPSTDAGALMQALILIPLELGTIWIFRRNRELRLLLTGVFMLTIAWMGLRALH